MVVVDSGFSANADAVVSTIKKITAEPVRYLIDTKRTGSCGRQCRDRESRPDAVHARWRSWYRRRFPWRRSVDTVRGRGPDQNEWTWRPDAFPLRRGRQKPFNQSRKYMYLNGEGIEIFHQPAAHSDGDAISFSGAPMLSLQATFSIRRDFPLSIRQKAAPFRARLPHCRSWSILQFPPCRLFRAKKAP